MVHKCGYLPLAISAVGRILSKKASLDEWTVVNKDIDSYLGREGFDGNRGIMKILTLSYDVLPYHLKQCFLSLGYFPEDLKIGTSVLYFTWLAEGITLPNKHSGREETVMVVTEQYLTKLASRSMVNVELFELAAPGLLKYKHCRLHDLMRELCLMKCSEEDYIKVGDFRGGRQPVLERFPVIMDDITTTNIYRLAIHTDGNFKGDAIGKITERLSPRLRSITFTDTSQGENCSVDMARTSSEIFNRFKYLRILSFDWYTFVNKKSIEFIGKLIHVRSIRFNSCKMDELPLQLFISDAAMTVVKSDVSGNISSNGFRSGALSKSSTASRLVNFTSLQ
ncbi:disease resistance protein RPH8A-like [Coffea arabica]|uniref:Disease resistance protein RPH8A-like n=1 Tax=Coffea arabica TaxID=13443 RepID=A0ABM4X812_COFAR